MASFPYKVHNYYSDNDLRYTIQASNGLYIQFKIEIEAVIPAQASFTTFQGIVSNTYQNTGTTVNIGYITNQYGILNVDLGVNLSMKDDEANCNEYKIRYRLTCVNGYPQFSSDWAEIKIIKHENISPLQNLTQRQNVNVVLTTPDLMIKDNKNDAGFEPFSASLWNSDYREITQSSDIYNTPINNLGVFENPMHSISIPQNSNLFGVKIRNSSCRNTPSAELNAYWTIARLWEPWASDWKNYNKYSSTDQTANNFVYDKNNIQRPLGNNITLTDVYDYASAEKTVTIPALPPGGSTNVYIPWIVPNPEWYLGTSTLPIQIKSTGEPVICLLARIEENWKTNNGYYLNPNPSTTKTNIVDYVSANNNAATRNTFILNSKNGYKYFPTGQNPRSRVGIIAINNPENLTSITIGMLRDYISSDFEFNNYARINLYPDSLVWSRWIAGGMLGNNFTVIENQKIQLNSSNFASLNNISLDDSEMGYLGVEVEFYSDNAPSESFDYKFSVGALDPNSINSDSGPIMIGSPSHFECVVLDSIKQETGDGNVYKKSVGINDVDNSNFKVFPNPASDYLIITDLPNINTYQIKLFNLEGKLVQENTSDKTNGILRMDVSDVPTGMYFIRITTSDGSTTRKINITR